LSFIRAFLTGSIRSRRGAGKMVCPACRRIGDGFEGGIVSLQGQFLRVHKQEIMNIIRNTENAQKNLRPLERVIKISEHDDSIEVTTTYEHLARRIGEAVNNAFKGNLELKYGESKKHVRVYWKRG
jgi:hypothetical protein